MVAPDAGILARPAPIGLAAQLTTLSRWQRGFESRWGHTDARAMRKPHETVGQW